MKKQTKKVMSAAMRAWWSDAVRLHRPQNMEKMRKQRNKDKVTVFALFKYEAKSATTESTAKRAKQRAEALVRFVQNFSQLAYYAGLRNGFKIGTEAAKAKPEDSQSVILEILRRHKNLTTRQICQRFDERQHKIPLPAKWRKSLLKKGYTGTRWTDAYNELGSVLVYFSRKRNEVRKSSQLKIWRRLLREQRYPSRSHWWVASSRDSPAIERTRSHKR